MKKIIFAVLFLSTGANQFAAQFSAGILYGPRTINDQEIKNAYGKGTVFFPYFQIDIVKGIILGMGYEGGYARTASLGLYHEKGTLDIEGYEIFVGYQLKIKSVSPYVKLGYNLFSYKQTIASPFLEEFKVHHQKTAVSFGGGLKIFIMRFLYVSSEVRYVPLKVKPFDIEVDLGGFRFLGGIGFTL